MSAVATRIDPLTEAWIRHPGDRKSALNGSRFSYQRGLYTCWWIERYCRLYQGEGAGEPMLLHTCNECQYDYDFEIDDVWDEEALLKYAERANRLNACIKAGHHVDWQFDCTLRCFGWEKYSKHWGRWVRRHRESSIWVSKKNKKSPTMSAWGLYLTCGDGEPGQNVYLGAKDGKQAKDIGARHAMKMVEQSLELSEECVINLTESSITHSPSSSKMIPLSSSNVKTIKSKEGLNGSLMIDEVHVVDREFMSTISRAGISRSEPLLAEFSTTGDDPDCYGKERFDHARAVLSGEVDDEQLFVAVYAPPQDISDVDLKADPMKYGRMANPAMGHTVNPEEFLNDFQASSVVPRKWVEFKKYRLNIWQHSTNPWLRQEWWKRGLRDYLPENLYGLRCWTALDLSAVRDFTALCLAFPRDDQEIWHLWYYWLPEAIATEYENQIPILDWKADPRVNLNVIPGESIDYGYVRSSYREICSRFRVQEIAYDGWNAEKVTQEISEGVRDHNGAQLEAPLGVKRVLFPQNLKTMNEPTKTFERRTIEGKTIHNGDPLTTWMMGNAQVHNDCNDNYKPLKPKHGSIKKIDGVITAIMADARIIATAGAMGSVYETRGIREL